MTVRGFLQRYVSKGGLKLEGALDAFPVMIDDRVCIDAGASTGGFTDCLLRRQARLVYAVDAGYGQLAGSLSNHPRVVNRERTNIGDDALLYLEPIPTVCVADLSYLSLRKAVPRLARIMRGKGDLICLVKPLFEIDDPLARRTGVIAEDAYAPLLQELIQSLADSGFVVSGLTNSPVTGNQGTLEFFIWVSLQPDAPAAFIPTQQAVEAVVSAAKALPLFKNPKNA